MAELGVVASVVTIVQLSEQILLACFEYYKTAKNAKQDILNIINVISGFQSTLKNLKTLVDEHGKNLEFEDPGLQNLKNLKKHEFGQCDEKLHELAALLGYETIETNTDSTEVKVSFVKRAKWPLKEKEVAKIVGFIESHKQTFILATSADSLQLDLEIKEIVTETSTTIQKMILSGEDEKVLSWLRLVNTSTNHKLACDKREPTTGDWFLQSESFVNWTKTQTASLWLHGIPGAGKTILCSTIIERVKNLCDSPNSLDQYAYFYFDFRDKPSAALMLRCIIADLCDRKMFVPAQLHKLYRQCDNGRREPEQLDVIQIFSALLASTYRTFIILDALDECSSGSDRNCLLKVLKEMISMENLSILLTSRREKDIAEKLDPLIDVTVDLKDGGIESDIGIHVRKCLEDDEKLRTWNPNTKQMIQKALLDGADGM